MSASTRTTTTVAEHGQLPGNCTLKLALETIVNVFHQYSTRLGNFDYLNFQELETLLKERLPTFLKACNRNNQDYLNKLFKESDLNKDKDLSFEEFTMVLAKVTDDAHRIIHAEDRCTPDKD